LPVVASDGGQLGLVSAAALYELRVDGVQAFQVLPVFCVIHNPPTVSNNCFAITDINE